jgi:adenine-specific DNA-methyltransferase
MELLHRLLAPEGVLFVNIDDNEGHYLKVMLDEVFGRSNFVTTFIWQKVDSPNDNKVPITPDHDYVLCFTKDKSLARFRQMTDATVLNAYSQRDEEDRLYRDRLLKKNGKNSLRQDRPSMFFELNAPDGTPVLPIHDDGREACWALGKAGIDNARKNGTLIWKNRGSKDMPRWIPYTREFAPETPSRPYPTIWTDLLSTRQAKAHQKQLLPSATEPFATPKTEQLLHRLIEMSTNEGDIVLDSFAGSGTTGAVAHKMRRRWIMVELGEHCHTHIVPRLKSVIDGRDHGGISSARKLVWESKVTLTKLKNADALLVELAAAESENEDFFDKLERKIEGDYLRLYGFESEEDKPFGGGFRYYNLAPSLLKEDTFGNWVISKEFNPAMLAEAVCKLEGFHYAPSDEYYWQHGHSTESDYIFVTTQTLSREQLQKLNDEVGPNRSLLVCCGAYRTKKLDDFPQLTVKKIPKAVLQKCEWGKDDYSLEIKALPDPRPAESNPVDPVLADLPKNKRKARKALGAQPTLFDHEDDF